MPARTGQIWPPTDLSSEIPVYYRTWDKTTRTWSPRPAVPAYPAAIVIATSWDDATATAPTDGLDRDAWAPYVEPETTP